jgi:hypothetical protein
MLRPGAKLPRVLFLLPEIMVLLPQWQYCKTDPGWLFFAFFIASPIFFPVPYSLLPVACCLLQLPPPFSPVSC